MSNDPIHDHTQYSPSALSLYRDCQTKFKYERVVKLTPRGYRTNHDLRYGSAAHAALAYLYMGKPIKDVGNIFKEVYPLDEYPNPLPVTASGKSQANFLAALWDYIQHQFPADLQDWEIVEVERVQSTEGLGDYEHMLVPDLIIRDRADGLFWLVDHKISGKYLNDLWGRYEMSSQIRTYTDYVKQRFGACGGFIINAFALRHRSRAVTPRSGPDRGVYLPAGDWFKTGRMVYSPNEDCLELERANIRATVDAIRRSTETDTWTYNANQCRGETPWACQYYDICKPGWSWPANQYDIEESYYIRCARQIEGESRCNREQDHLGECDENPRVPAQPRDIIVVPEDDPYYASVED